MLTLPMAPTFVPENLVVLLGRTFRRRSAEVSLVAGCHVTVEQQLTLDTAAMMDFVRPPSQSLHTSGEALV